MLENAGILAFASLLVMSVALGRFNSAMLWSGALLVFFAQAWEGRVPFRSVDGPSAEARQARPRLFDALRWLGVMLALGGATLAA